MTAKQELDVFIHDMLELSAFCYHFHGIRTIVRVNNGKTIKSGCGPSRVIEFKKPELIITRSGTQVRDRNQQLRYDITPANILDFIKLNRSLFKDDDKDGSLEFDKSDTPKDKPFLNEAGIKDQAEDDVRIIDYDDRFSTKKGGLVYGVMVNHTQKWVTVVFRGTVGISDIWTDRNFRLDRESFFENEKYISVPGGKPATHKGFTSYLSSNRERDSVERPYVDRVLACVNAEFGDNPEVAGKGFKLFVTGHSLGGGLANLFSFRAAQLKSMGDDRVKDLPDVVKSITFASPCVGNKDYNKEFQALEEKGFLRHIRVANQGDVVPTNRIGFPYRIFIGGNTKNYTQNGVNLMFFNDKKVEASHGNTMGFWAQWLRIKSLNIHMLPEYRRRVNLEVNQTAYDKSIDDIYEEVTQDAKEIAC